MYGIGTCVTVCFSVGLLLLTLHTCAVSLACPLADRKMRPRPLHVLPPPPPHVVSATSAIPHHAMTTCNRTTVGTKVRRFDHVCSCSCVTARRPCNFVQLAQRRIADVRPGRPLRWQSTVSLLPGPSSTHTRKYGHLPRWQVPCCYCNAAESYRLPPQDLSDGNQRIAEDHNYTIAKVFDGKPISASGPR